MRIRKLVLGGEQWLPFALSKLRAVAARVGPDGYGSQHSIMPDGTEIEVRVAAQDGFVRIEGRPLSYEFFVPERIPQPPWPSGSYVYATQDPATTGGVGVVAGSGVKYAAGASRPVFSEVFKPKENEGNQWPTRPVAPLTANTTPPAGVVRAGNFFWSWASWQNQKAAEHIHYAPDGTFTTSTRGYGYERSSHAGAWGYAAQVFLDPLANDVGKDIPPAHYETRAKGAQAGAPELPEHIDWRRAAVHTAKSEKFGTRKFFVLSDTHGRFHVYPVEDYFFSGSVASARAIPASMVKTYTPSYPSWVTVSSDTVSRASTYREAFLWEFNTGCTKMVCTPFKEEPGTYWSTASNDGEVHHNRFAYHTESPNPTYNRVEREIGSPTEGEIDDPAKYTQGRNHTPGMVELGLSIRLTGKERMDFEATFTVLQSSFWDEQYRYYVSAAYLMKNERMGKDSESILGAPAGALITAELELFWAPPEDPDYQTIGRRNIAPQLYEVNSNLPTGKSLSQAPARSYYGLLNRGRIFYTVRNHATQKVLRRFMLVDNFGSRPGEGWFAHIRPGYSAISRANISSLMFSTTTYLATANGEGFTGKRVHTLYAFNELQAVLDDEGATDDKALKKARINEPVGEPFVQVPQSDPDNSDVALLYLHTATPYLIRPSFFHSFTAHPSGSWASGLAVDPDPTGKLDIIQAYRGNAALKRTSHRAEFNKAFGQNRPATFQDGNSIAPMATTGIWTTL